MQGICTMLPRRRVHSPSRVSVATMRVVVLEKRVRRTSRSVEQKCGQPWRMSKRSRRGLAPFGVFRVDGVGGELLAQIGDELGAGVDVKQCPEGGWHGVCQRARPNMFSSRAMSIGVIPPFEQSTVSIKNQFCGSGYIREVGPQVL